MAEIVLGLGTGHASTLVSTPPNPRHWELQIERDQQDPRIDYRGMLRRAPATMNEELIPERRIERYQACLKAIARITEVLEQVTPDVIVMVGDDHHEQFLDDNLPTFAIFHGEQMPILTHRYPWQEDGGSSADSARSVPGDPELALHLIRYLCDAGFDLTRCSQVRPEEGLGHAFSNPYRRYLPERTIPIVPLMVNTYFPPNVPTPRRCYTLGEMLGVAIRSWSSDKRVAIMASGGLSHAALDERLDRRVLGAMLREDAETLCSLPVEPLVHGTSEIRNWIVVAGAVTGMEMELVDYVPMYRSPAGTGCGGGFALWRP